MLDPICILNASFHVSFQALTPFFRTAQSANPSPEKLSSFLSQMLFLWFDPTVWRARKRTVTLDDLWDLNREDRYEPLLSCDVPNHGVSFTFICSVEYLFPRFDKIWSRKQAKRRPDKGLEFSAFHLLFIALSSNLLTNQIKVILHEVKRR